MSDAKKLLSERLERWAKDYPIEYGGQPEFTAHLAAVRALEQELADLRETLQDAEANLAYADTQIDMLNDEVNDWRKAAQAAVTARKMAEKEAAEAREMAVRAGKDAATWQMMARGMPEEVIIDIRRVRREALQEALRAVHTAPSATEDCYAAIRALLDVST